MLGEDLVVDSLAAFPGVRSQPRNSPSPSPLDGADLGSPQSPRNNVMERLRRRDATMQQLCSEAVRSAIQQSTFPELKQTVETLFSIWCGADVQSLVEVYSLHSALFASGDIVKATRRFQLYNMVWMTLNTRKNLFSKPFERKKEKEMILPHDVVVLESEVMADDASEELGDGRSQRDQQVAADGYVRDYQGNRYNYGECRVLENSLVRILAAIKFGMSMVEKSIRIFYNAHPSNSPYPAAKLEEVFGGGPDGPDDMMGGKDPSPVQHLIVHLMEEVKKLSLRKDGKLLYRPIFVEEERPGDAAGGGGFPGGEIDSMVSGRSKFTHAYKQWCTVEEFVFKAAKNVNSKNNWIFLALTSRSNAHSQCSTWLEKCQSEDLPFMKKKRDRIAFANGIFDGETGRFIPWSDLNYQELSEPDAVCAKFFNRTFPEERVKEEESSLGRNDPMLVATPLIDKILLDQDFDYDTIRWIYALIGRIIVYRDGWEKAIMFYGMAGCGKSTLLSLLMNIWDPTDVGILDNNTDVNFPFAHVWNKFCALALDIDGQCSIPQMEFNHIVSKEPIALREKFKTDRVVTPMLPIAMAGNNFPGWRDDGNSLSRRLVPIVFTNAITKDTKLLHKIKENELAPFLYKVTNVYLRLRDKVGDQDVLNFLPPKFLEMRLVMQRETNPVQAFISDETEILLCKEGSCAFAEFRKRFMEFLKRNSSRSSRKKYPDHELKCALHNNPGVKVVNPRKRKRGSATARNNSAVSSSSSSSPSSSSSSPLSFPSSSSSSSSSPFSSSSSNMSISGTPPGDILEDLNFVGQQNTPHPYQTKYITGIQLLDKDSI